MDFYEYEALQQDEIRLLDLHPGEYNDNLQCTLRHISVHSGVSYDALSYTWGSAERPFAITCLKHEIPITKNLNAALLRLRTTDRVRTLWIDQICINQDQISERNKQVMLMSLVYHQATRVIIWIGDEDEDTKLAFEIVPILIKRASSSDLDGLHKTQHPIHTIGFPFVRSHSWSALSRIFSRPWFRRVWVVQEVALATHATVQCGTFDLPWKDLVQANSYVQYGQEDAEHAHDAVSIISSLQLGYGRSGQDSLLTNLLFWSYHFHCTDPRDKIFGLLALAKDGSDPSLAPDYGQSVQETYARVTRYLIGRNGCLSILCSVFHPKRVQNLPSWVPDWTSHLYFRQGFGSYFAKLGIFDYPRSPLKRKPYFSPDLRTLLVHGTIIDTIRDVNQIMFHPEFRSVLPEWEKMAQSASHVHGETFPTIFWRALLADDGEHGVEDDKKNGLLYAAFKSPPDDDPYNDPEKTFAWRKTQMESMTFYGAMEEVCNGRRLVVTEKNYLGLAPADTCKGDFICFLDGCPIPVVIHKHTITGIESFVGGCYLQGSMYQAKTRNEAGNQLFQLH